MAAFLPTMTRSKHSNAPAHEVAAIDFPLAAIGAFLVNVTQESGIARTRAGFRKRLAAMYRLSAWDGFSGSTRTIAWSAKRSAT
ncbi:hypothetical protein CSZ94_12660 [Janthinobacterium sp. ROICE36]|uniref:hypothetical protein n=1 Tax=Janthinobacterium sp. ROICE36 TaxID=2048670 RepID=UPI000CACA376|nr:hypothetical protein [Janthinobacterium sp. ROICE36]PLY41988.1 hypothetical protein CSZ94_12660 [Janthinobacterium sp. ROICE36]